MLNVHEQRINEIEEGEKFIGKNYELIRKSKLYDGSYDSNTVNFERFNTTELFDYRHYIFDKDRLLVGQKVGSRYDYYDVFGGYRIETFTDAKRPREDKFDNEERSDIEETRRVRNLVTGMHMNVTSIVDGKKLSNSDMRLDINKNISVNLYGNYYYTILGDDVIELNYTGRISEPSYSTSKVNSVGGRNRTHLSRDTILEMISKYLETLGFTKVKKLPVKSNEVRISGLTRSYNSSDCKIAYNKEDDSFYITPDVSFIYSWYSIKAKEFRGLKYMCIGTDLFYLEGETIKYALINTEYSHHIQNLNVILSEEGEIKFLDQPISKYFRMDKNLLVYKNNSIDVNTITATVENKESIYIVSSSSLEIISDFDDRSLMMPIKIKKGTYIERFYIIADDNGFYMYLYPSQDKAFQNVLTLPKYFKFNKKKSDVCVYNDLILINEGDGNFRGIKHEPFILDSLQTIGIDNFRIKGKDGYDYVSNGNGLFKLELPYEDYDKVSTTSEGDSNVVTLKNNSVKVNGVSVDVFGADSVVIKDEEGNVSILEYTTMEVAEDSIKLKVSYPYDALKHNSNTITFNINTGVFSRDDRNALIRFKNDKMVVYRLKNSTEQKGAKYYFYSKITKEYFSSSSFSPKYSYFEMLKEYSKKNVFKGIPGHIYVHGYFVKDDLFSSLGDKSNRFIEDTIGIMNKKDVVINSNEEAADFLEDSLYDRLLEITKEYDIDVTKEDIKNCKLPKELNLILGSIGNINSRVKSTKYREIFKEIENQLKGKTTLQTELFENQNLINESEFRSLGISLDKFNNFDTIIDFKASSGDGAGLKDAICTDMYSQIEILLGSRSKGKKGFLQINKLNTVCTYMETYMDMEVSLDSIVTDKNGEPISDSKLVKEINKLGFKFFGLLKKYNISLDLVNDTFIIAGKNAKDVRFEKLISIAKDFIKIKDKVLSDIDKNQIFNNALKVALKAFIEWSIGHVKEALENIENNHDKSDDTVEELQIKLWDRHNILEALTQGSKTHCCLAVNSFNIGKLVEYIYNKNINLVEIRNKRGVIGQAFVSLYKTRAKFNYRYENKHHLFMIIDNIELNNSYAKYHDDIAHNLQKFMNLYMLHTSDKISDVFLGTTMSDIRPPYAFKQSIEVGIIGERKLYLDHSNVFYKFL